MTRVDVNVIYAPCALCLHVRRGCMSKLLNLPTDTHKSEVSFLDVEHTNTPEDTHSGVISAIVTSAVESITY